MQPEDNNESPALEEEAKVNGDSHHDDAVPSHVTTTSLDCEDEDAESSSSSPRSKRRLAKKTSSSGGSSNESLTEVYKRQHQVIAASRRGFAARQATRQENGATPPTRLQQTFMTPLDKLHDKIQQFRYKCGVVVNAEGSQFFIVYLIAINAIMMGIGTFDFVRNNPRVEDAFEMVDTIFLIIFSVELGMQFAFYGWRLILDGWLVFDLVIITLSWAFASVQIIRAFRVFRAFRLITRIKVLKNLVLALFSVVPRMFAIGILLLLVSYIFAVMFTQLFKDLHGGEIDYTTEDYFGTMGKTFFTLFQIMTLDNWADIAREVMDAPNFGWAWLPFIVFVIVTGFVVVNLIIAVICDAISALHDDEKAKLHGTFEEEGSHDDDEEEEEEEHPALKEDVQEQLDSLEQHVKELARMQEDSLLTLELLTRQLQAQRSGLALSDSTSGSSTPTLRKQNMES